MRTTKLLVTAAALVLLGAVTVATAMGPLRPDRSLRILAVTAASEDPAAAKEARDALRAAGPDGLAAMQFQFRPDIVKALSGEQPADDPAWRRTREALDAVAAQRDAHASGLYWYTDLEMAKAAAARESGKPILSLRLLGTLDSELSCANSRFFRTALYANAEVSAFLRENVILHWQSVRPVPRVTIDMGDGRKIYRTITGNSIHYVLDADGRPVDAVPGLYGPDAFLRAVNAALAVERKVRGLGAGDRASVLAAWHGERVRLTDATWAEDMKTLGVLVISANTERAVPPGAGATAATVADGAPSARVAVETAMPKAAASERRIVRDVVPPAPAAPSARAAAKVAVGKRQAEVRIVNAVTSAPVAEPAAQIVAAPAPTAKAAAGRAVGKGRVELRIVDAVAAAPANLSPAAPAANAMTPDLWPQIARLHAADGLLDAGSRRLMRSKFPAAKAAGAATLAKADVEDPLLRTIANFERSVAEDTVRNEYTFHRQIHVWFGQQLAETADVDALNKRVYAELFLTPDSDPWLGLVPADTYSALQDDGMSEACLK